MHKLKIINKRKTPDGTVLVRTDSNPDWKKVTEKEGSIEYDVKSTDKWLNLELSNIEKLPLYVTASSKEGRIFSVEINEVNKKEFGLSFPLTSLYAATVEGELKYDEEPPENLEIGEDPPE